MASVKVRNLEIGVELPKICVPIVDKTEGEILGSARKITETKADLVEWRVDWFDEIFDFERVQEVLEKLREVVGERPILFTCRTSNEGGQISLTKEQYAKLNQYAIESGYIDLVDVEVFGYADVVEELVSYAHKHDVKVVGSNHDFNKTPAKEEIIRRLCHMQVVGADIPKIAVMPQTEADVLTLLGATKEMTVKYADRPIITMSMAGMGVVSRIAGEIFGSAVTFGAMHKASAPGQLEVQKLREILEILHQAQ